MRDTCQIAISCMLEGLPFHSEFECLRCYGVGFGNRQTCTENAPYGWGKREARIELENQQEFFAAPGSTGWKCAKRQLHCSRVLSQERRPDDVVPFYLTRGEE